MNEEGIVVRANFEVGSIVRSWTWPSRKQVKLSCFWVSVSPQ